MQPEDLIHGGFNVPYPNDLPCCLTFSLNATFLTSVCHLALIDALLLYNKFTIVWLDLSIYINQGAQFYEVIHPHKGS